MQSVTLTAPAYWAGYFINHDPQGLDIFELHAADAFLAAQGMGFPVDATDLHYASTHDAWRFWPYAGDVGRFTFQKREG